MTPTPRTITMAGAERGRVRPEWPVTVRVMDDEGRLSEESAKLVLVPPKWEQRFSAWALRYLSQPHLYGGGPVPPDDLAVEEALLKLCYALRKADGTQRFPFPQNLFDETTKAFNPKLLETLEIRDYLAPGEPARLAREYRLFVDVEAPPALSAEDFARLVDEGKDSSLRTLLLRHGSSAILPVLRGMEGLYRASEATSG